MFVPSAQGITGHRLEGDASHRRGFLGPGLTCEEVCAPRGGPGYLQRTPCDHRAHWVSTKLVERKRE